jgi:hypothetical protein
VRLEINVSEHGDDHTKWLRAAVEDKDGNLLGSVTAPLVEMATFDTRGAVIRAAVESAIQELNRKEEM